jgi:putative ABC transport system permease protein
MQGRDFNEQDDENSPRVAIINEAFARRFWPGEDPIGKRFSSGNSQSPLMQVIGVVEDGKYAGLAEDPPRPFFCRSLKQSYSGTTALVVRTEGDPQNLIAAVRNEAQRLDPRLPISSRTLTERMAVPLLPARVAAGVLGAFGLLALALAAIGIYGVMSCSVARRTHEIGIRMSLGAQKGDVLSLVIGDGMKLVLVGLAIGLAAALALTRLMKSFLFGVSATDPLTYAGVALLLAISAFAACYLPARKATAVDPIAALRHE